MNSLERVRAVIAGKIPDRVPVCLHNFMLAAREADVPVEKYRSEPEMIAKVHLQALEKYGHDCLLIDTDTTMMAESMGAKSAYAPNEPGRIVAPAIQSLAKVGRLKVVDPEKDGRIPAILEAVRLLAKQVGREVAIRGNADAMAFSLACEVRGIEDFLMDLAENPAKNTVGAQHVLFGNIDPSGVLALGSVEEVRERTSQLIAVWKPGAHFVLNAGCAIPPTAPPDNIRAMIETAHREGVYN